MRRMRSLGFLVSGLVKRKSLSRSLCSRRVVCSASMKYLNQESAAAVDEVLMGPSVGFTLEQLMELAGLAVAQVVEAFKPERTSVVVVAGPGNNGGDGLVAARHLHCFGYDVQVLYPKQGRNPHYVKLVKQLEADDIPLVTKFPSPSPAIILDAIFGFSFHGAVREPFIDIIKTINANSSTSTIISVDVPSGWDVDGTKPSDPDAIRIQNPACIVSLTAPKVNAPRTKPPSADDKASHPRRGRTETHKSPAEGKTKAHLDDPSRDCISYHAMHYRRLYGPFKAHTLSADASFPSLSESSSIWTSSDTKDLKASIDCIEAARRKKGKRSDVVGRHQKCEEEEERRR